MLSRQQLGSQPCVCGALRHERQACDRACPPCQPSTSSSAAILPTSHRGQRSCRPHSLQLSAAAPAAATEALQLSSLELSALVNLQGFILPNVPAGTEASVFGIYDQNKNLQYVGFSKDYRNTLRTLLGRRPDKAWFHRAQHLEKLDQGQMMAIRDAWFSQGKGAPPGNKLPTERNAWQKPLAAIAISERGRLQAAQTLAQEQLLLLKGRGVREDFAINPAVLQEGLVDFLPSKAMTAEEIAEQQSLFESLAKATRSISVEVDGLPIEMQIFFKGAFRTNGGHMFDVSVTYDDKETEHRIIVGRDYYEFQGLSPEEVVERVLAFLTRKKIPRHTEGVLLSSQFPMNYFSITTVEQWFEEEEFLAAFENPNYILPGQSKFWRFNKIHTYGSRNYQQNVDQGLLVPAGEE